MDLCGGKYFQKTAIAYQNYISIAVFMQIWKFIARNDFCVMRQENNLKSATDESFAC